MIVWGEGASVTMMGLGVGFLFHVPKELCAGAWTRCPFPPPAAPPADDGGSPVTGFIVELCSGPERSVLNAEEPQLAIPDLTPGTTYQVRIAATSDGGQGKVLPQGLVDWLLVPATHTLPPSLSVVQDMQGHHCQRMPIRATCCGHCGVAAAT